ncbi:MAG: GNAT family N-acetyltransferase [Actinomycetota bacterium]|nr:GNAT family N-acetyltransferase [Actinomycetota bacterium]
MKIDFPAEGILFDSVLLRRFTVDDLEIVHAALNDDGIVEPADMPFSHPPLEMVRAVIEERLPLWLEEGYAATLGICDPGTGSLMGGGTVRKIRWDEKIGEVGYWLLPAARGRGVATTACRALAQYAFGLGLERIEAVTSVANEASQRVLERVGFTREGVLRSVALQRGGRGDVVMWSLLPGEL